MAIFSNKIREASFFNTDKTLVEILYNEDNNNTVSYLITVDFQNPDFKELMSEIDLEQIEKNTKDKQKIYKQQLKTYLNNVTDSLKYQAENSDEKFLERLEKFFFEFNEKDDELLFKLKLKMFESIRLKSCNDVEKKSKIRNANTPLQLIKEFENI
jgi:hypothetical protein